MDINNYLKDNQKIVYKTLFNALKNNKFPHSIMLSGELGIPLKEIAIFIAKTILCENPTPFACLNCNTCKRIDNSNFGDLILIDGSDGEIKKDDIERIVSSFSYTGIEKRNKSIYIINLIEHANASALNSLLKFLEEPFNNTYAIITTRNENMILPTIISRCQILKLNLIPRKKIIDECKDLNQEDVEILTYFYNSRDMVINNINNEDYLEIKKIFFTLFKSITNLNEYLYNVELLIPSIKNKESIRFLLDMFISFFLDLLRNRNHEPVFLKSYVKMFNDFEGKLINIEKLLLEIMDVKNNINYNVSLISIMEHIGIYVSNNCIISEV